MKDLPFDSNARKLLLRRLFEGSPNGVNYAPDSRYDAEKRCNVTGPLTIQISQILERHAKLWAKGMRDNEGRSAQEAEASWRLAMREADAEIKRLLAGHSLKGAA